MSRRSGLGKGLGALIPGADENTDESTTVRPPPADHSVDYVISIPIDEVRANPYQPRREFEPEALAQLSASIQEVGVLQPVIVRQVDEHFELIAGERRLRASRLAGRTEIPAIVRSVDNEASLEQAVVENLHRQDLNPLEEAAALRQLIDDFGLSQDVVAKRVGRSRPAVSNLLRLLALPADLQASVRDGRLSAGHARALLALENEAAQRQLAARVISGELSVRATETMVKERLDVERRIQGEPATGGSDDGQSGGRSKRPANRGGDRPAGVLELEELLSEKLSTVVSVELAAKRGRVIVEFADLDDLERIYRTIID